jgi:hypothetical protein
MNASVVAPVGWRHHSQAVTESIRPHHGEDHRGCAVTPPGCWHTERVICTRCSLNSGGTQARVIGDLISYQNDRKGSTAIAGKVEKA